MTGGEPWPPTDLASTPVQRAVSNQSTLDRVREIAVESEPQPRPVPTVAKALEVDELAAPAHGAGVPQSVRRAPIPAPDEPMKSAEIGKAKRASTMIGSRSLVQWIKLGLLYGLGAVVAAGTIVLAARGVTTFPVVPVFLKQYPGAYQPHSFVEPGFPAWANWAHYLNFFFMVLIVRTGLLVRHQQKPPAFYTPKRGGKKVGIYLWLHTSLDVLWLANGVCFVVLIFATGHWARIVPTSWEVFPNAISALLQYLTLQWPVENGWENYNSLQQLMYFIVVFIAAPLAAITGVRMSEWWPKNSLWLNRVYPLGIARAVHFPTMLFFVLFVIVHVFLVFATGVLNNLNHMFAGTNDINWVGFWIFSLGLAVSVMTLVAARPLILAPIAGRFGRVSNR